MGFAELFLLAVGLSMDAFAVSVCKGLAIGRTRPRHALCAGAWFGGFQALMPLIGFLLGSRFEKYIVPIDHWIAFALLCAIGANMIHEALAGKEEDDGDASMSFKSMLVMAVATSIDALAVGITFAFLQVRIVPAVALIGAVTFALSALGIKMGSVFGIRYKAKAELAGGGILILLGAKILLEHLEIISF